MRRKGLKTLRSITRLVSQKAIKGVEFFLRNISVDVLLIVVHSLCAVKISLGDVFATSFGIKKYP